MGVIAFIDRDGDPVGGGGHLAGGVDDAAVVLFPLPGSQDKESVGKLKHGLFVHDARLLSAAEAAKPVNSNSIMPYFWKREQSFPGLFLREL